jgi:hypothetical protein
MYNTAYGLSIALLCMLAHLLLVRGHEEASSSDLEAFSLRFENLLAEGGAAAAAGRTAGAAPGLDGDTSHADERA